MSETVIAALEATARAHPAGVAYAQKASGAWRETTWAEYDAQIRRTARGLMALGVGPGRNVAILSGNRPEWFLSALGAIAAGGVPAGIYATSSPEQCEYIARHCEAVVVVVENEAHLATFLAFRDRLAGLARDRAPGGPLRRPRRLALGRAPPPRRLRARRRARREAQRPRSRGLRQPHLHLGHHRPPQGGDDQPPQHRVRGGHGHPGPGRGPRRPGTLLPAPVPRGRAEPEPLRSAPDRPLDLLRREPGEGARQPARGAADLLLRGAAGVGEDAGGDRGGARRGEPPPAAGPPLGLRAGPARRYGPAPGPARGTRLCGGPRPRAVQGPGQAGPRPRPPLPGLRRARHPRDPRLLPGPGHPHPRALRHERVLGARHPLPARRLPARKGGPRPRGHGASHRGGRRGPHPGAARLPRLPEGRRGHRATPWTRTAGCTRATWASSTRAAT